jgi:hypothetical protein
VAENHASFLLASSAMTVSIMVVVAMIIVISSLRETNNNQLRVVNSDIVAVPALPCAVAIAVEPPSFHVIIRTSSVVHNIFSITPLVEQWI